MNRIVFVFVLIICVFVLPEMAYGQTPKPVEPLSKHIPTENVDAKKEMNKRRNRPETSEYDYIYKQKIGGVLLGNACALQATRKMGFEYVLQPVGGVNGISPFRKVMNNFWINTKLVFKRTPFWKLILNKKIEDCRQKSGDFVG